MSNRLKELRCSAGVTQKELASALGVAQPTLSGWENGRFQIDYDSLIKIADYFNTTIDYLLGRDVENSLSRSDITTDKPVLRSDDEKLLGVYHSLDEQSKTQLMSVAYLLAANNLAQQGVDVNRFVEQQLHKIHNKGGEENEG